MSPPLRYCIRSGRENNVDPRDFIDETSVAEIFTSEHTVYVVTLCWHIYFLSLGSAGLRETW